jgi:hypothetical protein
VISKKPRQRLNVTTLSSTQGRDYRVDGKPVCQAGTDRAAAASSSNAVEMPLILMTPIKLLLSMTGQMADAVLVHEMTNVFERIGRTAGDQLLH